MVVKGKGIYVSHLGRHTVVKVAPGPLAPLTTFATLHTAPQYTTTTLYTHMPDERLMVNASRSYLCCNMHWAIAGLGDIPKT